MRSFEDKAVWRHAQTLALIVFLVLGAALYWGWSMLSHVRSDGLRDLLEMAVYVASFFAVFTIQPLTYHFYSRLIRR